MMSGAVRRQAGLAQGVFLILGSCLPVLGAVLLAPVLPDVQRAFATTPGVAVMTPVMLTLPALMIGICAPFAGMAVDRIGRRRLLLVTLVIYSLIGTAPLYLPSLPAILVARAGLGMTEAVIMTVCTTLIGDYFTGARRETWLSLQGAAASLAAMMFFGVGGALGTFGWRTPFWLYAAGIVLLPAAFALVWEPKREQAQPVVASAPRGGLPWPVLLIAYPFAVITGMALLMMPIQAGFLLNTLGIFSPAIIGLTASANQGAVFIGSLMFRPINKFGYAMMFGISFVAAGGGLLLASQARGQTGVLIGGVVNGFGAGLLLVGLINWALASLPWAIRGRGTGGFMSCVFIGQFISPLFVLLLKAHGFSLFGALAAFGWVVLAMSGLGVALPLLVRRATTMESMRPVNVGSLDV